ncbi:hypothetical protein AWC38_SpisGene15593 [Stylophora pistillata]|uniref:Uncharacterized protein n=1 Tax=Stylophora pistillata TaxID=50429 RepID=A0A2B4RQT6_STYPI|nr:hypothetical protein AWC38_SpisGene15593 [Stylophora pistillata]
METVSICGGKFEIEVGGSHVTSLPLCWCRYYDEEKGGCLNCSRCCGDHADLVVAECREKLGAGSSMICSFNSSVNRCYKTSQPTHTTIQNSLTQPTPTAILVSLSPPRVDDPSKRKFPWIVFGVSVSSSLVLSFVLTVVWKLFKRLAKFQKSSNRTSEKVTTCELPLKDLVEELSLIVQDTSPERTTLADEILQKNDRAALEKHRASFESVVTAVTSLKESIEEKKFAEGEDEQAVQEWAEEFEESVDEADKCMRQLARKIELIHGKSKHEAVVFEHKQAIALENEKIEQQREAKERAYAGATIDVVKMPKLIITKLDGTP